MWRDFDGPFGYVKSTLAGADESLVDAQTRLQTTCCRTTRCDAVQRPTAKGGVSHLFHTDAVKIYKLCLTSRRDYIIRTNLRLRDCS